MSGEVAIVTALGAQDNIITTFSPFSCFKYGQDMLVKITILGNNLSIFLFMPCIINIFLPLSCFEYVTMYPVQSRRENTFIRYRWTRWRVYATGGQKERGLSCTETGKGPLDLSEKSTIQCLDVKVIRSKYEDTKQKIGTRQGSNSLVKTSTISVDNQATNRNERERAKKTLKNKRSVQSAKESNDKDCQLLA